MLVYIRMDQPSTRETVAPFIFGVLLFTVALSNTFTVTQANLMDVLRSGCAIAFEPYIQYHRKYPNCHGQHFQNINIINDDILWARRIHRRNKLISKIRSRILQISRQ